MKKFIVILFCLTISIVVTAQNKPITYKVSGQIVEKISGKSIPYATIIFIKNDTTKEKRAQAADANGRFIVSLNVPFEYTLTVSSMGYKEFSQIVKVVEPKTDIGVLTMEEGIEIQEVTVGAQKPLVKMEVDKIVYSMESDPEAQTNNALEMLRKVPLVTVDAEENVTLNGQSNFKILINGKSSSMMSTNFKEVLKSMPANTIKDIEIITNPSSKYEAEGVGGIINIITNKKTLNGYSGSVSAGMDSRGSFNGSAYLAAKIGKFSFSSRYYGSQYKQPGSEFSGKSEYFNNTDYHYSNSYGKNSYNGLSNGFSGEASYDIDSLNLISLSFWGYSGYYKSSSFSETQYMNLTNDITRRYTNTSESKYNYGSLSGNIDYQKTFKKPDKSLTFSYKLDDNPSIANISSSINGINNYTTYNQRSKNDAVGREHTFQADYYDPLTEKHQVEGGLKYILRQNTSVSEMFLNDSIVNTGNDLDYDQHILGAYLGYVFVLKKISAKTGMRLERTWNDGVSTTMGQNTDFTNRLFNIVPYVSFSYMPKESSSFNLSYTQRLSRPGIWYLNPFVNSEDSMNISYGNPLLKAEVSHNFEFSYSYYTPKFNMSASATSYLTNNSIENISKIQTSGATVSTYENIGKNQYYGVSTYFSYMPNEKISINFNGGVSYSKMEANTGYAMSNEGFNYNGSLGGRWVAWKNGSISFNGGVYAPSIMLQGTSSARAYTSISVSQYFLKRKLMLSASATDPFWDKKKYSYNMTDVTFNSRNESYYYAQNFRLSITYNFGKMNLQVKKARRGIQNDDLKSGGGQQAE